MRRDTNRVHDVFVRNLRKERTERVSVSSSGRQANRQATAMRISANGRIVTWGSSANNLVRGDTNRGRDLFQHDRRRDRTRRVTLTNRDRQVPDRSIIEEVSRSGRYVAFRTQADLGGPRARRGDSWDVYVRDVRAGRTRYLTRSTAYGPWTLSDRKHATFTATRPLVAEDVNSRTDVYFGRFR